MDGKHGITHAVCLSDRKGIRKTPQKVVKLVENFGIQGDSHADSSTKRQVSLLMIEQINEVAEWGLNPSPGLFAENITTKGVDLTQITPGTKIKLGKNVLIEITQIGKQCHTDCEIFRKVGKCIMPLRGIFARVVRGGTVHPGDSILIL